MDDPEQNRKIYPPMEDSFFLEGFVEKNSFGKAIDVGCGSGIQSKAAAKNSKVTQVIAVDKNPAAITALNQEIEIAQSDVDHNILKKIHAVQSDMFSAVEGERFDTIICNPPYLPNDEGIEDIALYGGDKGYEWTIRFLNLAKDHLAPNGHILLLFSSLTNKELIDKTLKQMRYSYESLGELYTGMFEHLYVYRIWRLES